ncbi:MAG: tetratricopeptide repeat protein [Cytophagales bacterium]|nr:tetratricopeptide repeat protein [Cytophagales bacterium]
MCFKQLIWMFFWVMTFMEVNAQEGQLLASGMQHFEKEDYKNALLKFNKVIEADKANADAFYMRGRVKQVLEDFHGAMKDFNHAISIDQKVAHYYFDRGNIKYELQDYYGAISDYSQAIALDVTHVDAYFKRGKAKHQLEAYQDAINDCTKILEIHSNNVDAYYLRGILRIEHGQLEQGCLDLSKAGELGDLKAYEVIKERCNSKR